MKEYRIIDAHAHIFPEKIADKAVASINRFYEIAMYGKGTAKGGTVHLFIDGRPAGDGRVGRTQPLPFASDEPLDIGTDGGSPVTRDYTEHDFSGEVNWVEIEIPEGAPDSDAKISDRDRLQAALVRE